MIINNFKLFEKLSIGSIERGEYKELLVDGVNEGILNSIVNFFSKALGGSIDKLDKLIRKYKDNEIEYWEEWADARGKFNKADALSKEAKTDPVEKAKYEEQKERLKKLQSQIEIKRKDVLDSLNRQVSHIIKDSTRLKDYYDLKKAKADEEVARDSFDAIKDSSKDEALKALFDKNIQSAVATARKRNEEFKSKYGDIAGGKFFDVDDDNGDLSVSGIKIKDLLTKPLSELQDKFRAMNPNRLDDINKFLEKELKKTKDKRDDDIKNVKNRISDKESLNKEIDDISKKVKSNLENLQDKIDYIDKLMLSSRGTDQKPAHAEKVEKEIKQNPEIVTPDTEKELGVKGIDAAVNKAVVAASEDGAPTVKKVEAEITEQVKKNFAEAKGTVEAAVGEQISDANYSHIKNDLINAYGKLLVYYKGMKQDPPLSSMQFGLIDFAAEIYNYKKKNGTLAKDLSSKELDKLLDKYSK